MRKFTVLAIVAAFIVAGVAAYLYFKDGRTPVSQHTYSAPGSPARPSHPIEHVVIIMEENKPAGAIIGNSAAPYLNHLLETSALAQDYYAITNPSLPNYIALTSGTTAGITNNCNPPGGSCQADVTNIADIIERSGRSWKEYAESMPTACAADNSGEYAVKHNPFMYYPDITSDRIRCTNHVVPFSQFGRDLSGNLPNYSFITPNLCDDMHDCSVQTGDAWLSKQVPLILSSAAFTKQHSLLIITWDEGNTSDNHVAAIFAGPAAKAGYTSSSRYNHYSLLRTIENLWGLAPLTQNDRSAPTMNDMLR